MVEIPLVVKPLSTIGGRARRTRDELVRAILVSEVLEDSLMFHQTRSKRIVVSAAEITVPERVPIRLDLAKIVVCLDGHVLEQRNGCAGTRRIDSTGARRKHSAGIWRKRSTGVRRIR